MNRNDKIKDENIMHICNAIKEMSTPEQVYDFLCEVLTKSEIEALSKRWRILSLLQGGVSQREIAKKLHVSLCNITRGAAILKSENAIVKKILIKENKNAKEKHESGWTRIFRQIRG